MRISGVDDGYFPLSYKRGKGKTVLVVATFSGTKLTDLDFDLITVDGADGTEVYRKLRKGDVRLLDGITFAGFNYIDPEECDVVVFTHRPDLDKVERALEKHFRDQRKDTIIKVLKSLVRLPTPKGEVYVFSQLGLDLVREVIWTSQKFSKVPFQLSVTSEIAKKLSRFLLTGLNFL